jgi:hypothetical protein
MPIDEGARRDSVSAALRLMRKGAVVERAKIFAGPSKEPGTREFRRKVLNSLVSAGALRRTTKDGEAGVFYVLNNIDVIDKLLDREEALIEFIWPGSIVQTELNLPPPPAQQEEEQGPQVPALAPFFPSSSDNAQAVALDVRTIEETNRLLRQLLMTMSAVLQSTIYTRDQVGELKAKVQGLDAVSADTNLRVKQLIAELGGPNVSGDRGDDN